MHKRHGVIVVASLLLAGCATGSGEEQRHHQDYSQSQGFDKEKTRAVQALKKDGIDEQNLPYWRERGINGCAEAQRFPLPEEDPKEVLPGIEGRLGSIQSAFHPFYLVAEQSGVATTEPSQEATWGSFAYGFKSFKARMRAQPAEEGSSSAREEFLAMLGGAFGQAPRWQLWFADRFSTGLTLASFADAGKEAERLMQEHWNEIGRAHV
jgi:hypothetical protein